MMQDEMGPTHQGTGLFLCVFEHRSKETPLAVTCSRPGTELQRQSAKFIFLPYSPVVGVSFHYLLKVVGGLMEMVF